MVSTKIRLNKKVPTLHSSCRILITKVTKAPETTLIDSELLLQEGEINFHLEDADTSVDRDFVKLLLRTKLEEPATFVTRGLTVEFSIADIQYGPAIHELPDESKISRAREMKEKGSELFRAGKFEAAFLRFRSGVQYLIFMKDKTLPGGDDTYAMLCNNMAMCQMKLNNHQHAIDLCSKALKVEEHNVKALYRRAVCYSQLKRWEAAQRDLREAMSVEKNASVKKLMEEVQEQLNVQDQEYKNVVKNMFR